VQGHLHKLRKWIRNRIDSQGDQGRHLLELPSVLHRTSEIRTGAGPYWEVQQEVRHEVNRISGSLPSGRLFRAQKKRFWSTIDAVETEPEKRQCQRRRTWKTAGWKKSAELCWKRQEATRRSTRRKSWSSPKSIISARMTWMLFLNGATKKASPFRRAQKNSRSWWTAKTMKWKQTTRTRKRPAKRKRTRTRSASPIRRKTNGNRPRIP